MLFSLKLYVHHLPRRDERIVSGQAREIFFSRFLLPIMPKGETSSYLALLGQAECMRIVQERLKKGSEGYTEDAVTGCWLWVGRVLPEGYAQFKMVTPAQRAAGPVEKNRGINFLMHKVAYVAEYGLDVQHTASHLCARPHCFNPKHIVDESILKNNQRKGCVGEVRCLAHNHTIVDLCTHEPKCVKISSAGIYCCLSKAEKEERELAENASSGEDSDPVVPPYGVKRRRISSPVPPSSSSQDGPSQTVSDFLSSDVRGLPGAELLSDGDIDFAAGDNVAEDESQETDGWLSD